MGNQTVTLQQAQKDPNNKKILYISQIVFFCPLTGVGLRNRFLLALSEFCV